MKSEELQISKYKELIQSTIEKNSISIIIADVGMGKSTQIPKYLYELGYKIVITQPRRIACISLANRIGEELKNNSVASYETAFESNKNKNTRILFNTDGFRLAVGIDDLDNNSVLIIDEIHEWSVNIEILLGWIKVVRKTIDKNFKLVLMSATVRKEELIEFFKEEQIGILELKGYNYPVEKIFINNPNLLEKTILKYFKAGKNILCFQHGKKEINLVIESLKSKGLNNSNSKLIPLHGDLNYEEQIQVFKEYDLPKIVIATNIAQTSITIPDIDVVIDNGMIKLINTDNGIEMLKSEITSQSDCDQRAGRVGRTKEGIYILCSDFSYEERQEYNSPEITRVLLDTIILRLYSYGIEIDDIELIHLPDKELINKSKEILTNLGAIDLNIKEKNKLTPIGKQMISLPLSSRPSRMIIEAINNYNNKTLDNIIKIASILESGTLLQFNKSSYSEFSTEDGCDLLAEVDIFNFVDNHKINFDKLGINQKNYTKCKEYYNKVSQIVHNLTNSNDYLDCRDNIIKCIIVAMIDNLYERDLSNVKIDRKSCLNKNNIEFSAFIGIPRLIDAGYWNPLIIANFCTLVDYNILNRLYPDRISFEIDYYTPNDDSDKPKSFDAGILINFDEYIQIDSYYNEEIREDDYFYSMLLDRFLKDKEEQRLKDLANTIEINGKSYILKENVDVDYIEHFDDEDDYSTYRDERVEKINYELNISEEDLFNNLKDISIYKFKDKNVQFKCLGYKNSNLDELRKVILNKKKRDLLEKRVFKLLGFNESSNPALIYKGVNSIQEIDKLLKVYFSETLDNDSYLGLESKKKSKKNQIKLKSYKSRLSAITNTNEALKTYILRKFKLNKLPKELDYVNSITYKEIIELIEQSF